MKRLLFLIVPLLLVSCDVASRLRRATQTSSQKRNEEFGKVYDQQLELERQRAKQTAEQLAIEQEVWKKYAEDRKRNEQRTKEEEKRTEERNKEEEERNEIEKEVWRKYAEDAKRNEQRTKEEDARSERYEAVLKKWEEQATRFDAILDRWEKIEPLKPNAPR